MFFYFGGGARAEGYFFRLNSYNYASTYNTSTFTQLGHLRLDKVAENKGIALCIECIYKMSLTCTDSFIDK